MVFRICSKPWEGFVLTLFDNALATVLLGSTLIGLAAGLLTLLTGRVMSASHMIGSLLGGAEGLAATSIAFIGGILAAPLILNGLGFSSQPDAEADLPFLIAGGLLVGFGARFGGASLVGAMSCVARRSKQAVAIFVTILAAAAITVYLQSVLGGGGVA